MNIRKIAVMVPAILAILVLSCANRESNGTGTTKPDISALAGVYTQLANALNGLDTAALAALIDTGYYDGGVGRDSMLAAAAVYFNIYDSIDANFPLDSLEASIYGSMARVRHTLDVVSRNSLTGGDTLMEFTSGSMDWILRNGAWKIYGNQLDTVILDNPELPDTASTGLLRTLASHYAAALAIPAHLIGELTWYRAGQGTSYTDVAFLPASDTTDTDSLVIEQNVLAKALGHSSAGGVVLHGSICFGALYDSTVSGSLFFFGTCNGLAVNGAGRVSGTGDTLSMKLSVSVAGSVTVNFDGAGYAARAADGNHAADTVLFGNGGMGGNTWIVQKTVYGAKIFDSAVMAADSGYDAVAAANNGRLGYVLADSVPHTGHVFSDYMDGIELDGVAYADTINGWHRRWVDQVTGKVNNAQADAYFVGIGSHRGGTDGISGYLTNVPMRLPGLNTSFRDTDEFYIGISYGANNAAVRVQPVAGGTPVASDTLTY